MYSAQRPPPGETCPQQLPKEASGGHPNEMPQPPQLAPFEAEEQWLYTKPSELTEDRVPHPTPKGEPSHLSGEANFWRS